MTDTERAFIPVAAFLINLTCPAVPAVVWTAIFTAVLSGDLTPAHIEAFMKQNNIKTYSNNDQLNPLNSDFPDNARNGGETP